MRGGRHAPLTEAERKNAPKITWPLIKRVFSYLLPYWPRLLLVVVAILCSSAFALLPSLLTGKIIDEGLLGGNLNQLIILIVASFGVLLASNLIEVLESYINTWMAQHITQDMRNEMYTHLLYMPQSFFTDSNQGEIITRMTTDIDGVQSVISGTLTSILKNLSTLVLAITAMYQKNLVLATIGICIVPLFIIPTKKVGNKRWTITRQAQEKNDEINQMLNETLGVSGQALVKLYTKEEVESAKYAKANAEMTDLRIKESVVGRWFRVVMNLIANAGPMLIYLVGGLLLLQYGNTSLTVGDITVMVTLLSKLYMPVNSLLTVQVDVVRSMALFTRLFAYFDMPITIKNKQNPLMPKEITGKLRFVDVRFAYGEGKETLKDISFTVEPGKSVAIVGKSGAGKSTVVNLIPRLYDVTAGAVLLDEHDIRDFDITWLRQNIGVVTQESYLFNGTIADNLRYAKPDATEEMLVEACEKANIHDFIARLPNGYDTIVGNRGVKLSGGEKQRVCIARMILKDPKVLILDEATSALDSVSENAIQEAIEPLLKNRTSIVIAHRLSTIMAADEIIVLQDGQIVERGTHKALLGEHGAYEELYETQFKKALEDHIRNIA